MTTCSGGFERRARMRKSDHVQASLEKSHPARPRRRGLLRLGRRPALRRRAVTRALQHRPDVRGRVRAPPPTRDVVDGRLRAVGVVAADDHDRDPPETRGEEGSAVWARTLLGTDAGRSNRVPARPRGSNDLQTRSPLSASARGSGRAGGIPVGDRLGFPPHLRPRRISVRMTGRPARGAPRNSSPRKHELPSPCCDRRESSGWRARQWPARLNHEAEG